MLYATVEMLRQIHQLPADPPHLPPCYLHRYTSSTPFLECGSWILNHISKGCKNSWPKLDSVCFADVLMLMASGLETEPQSNISTQEDDTLTPSNKSQADSLSGSTSGLERSESGLSLAIKLRRSSSSGHFTSRSPLLSPRSEGQTGPADSLILDQDSWDSRVSETETGTPGSGQSRVVVKTTLVQSSQFQDKV